jgi:hypothetical protein
VTASGRWGTAEIEIRVGGAVAGGSAIDGQQLEGLRPILRSRTGVGAGRLQPGVAHQLGDQDQVGAAPDEGGAEGGS